MITAGIPAITTPLVKLFVTIEPFAITEFSPIVTPFKIVTLFNFVTIYNRNITFRLYRRRGEQMISET